MEREWSSRDLLTFAVNCGVDLALDILESLLGAQWAQRRAFVHGIARDQLFHFPFEALDERVGDLTRQR
jgi:hypothetical protein